MTMIQQGQVRPLLEFPLRMPNASFEIDGKDIPSDMLARDHMIQHIAEDIRTRNLAVLGVYGTWGSGKSSLMRLVIDRLNKQNEDAVTIMICCTFSPWRYEIEGELAAGLIKTLRDIKRQNVTGGLKIVDLEGIKRQAGGVLKHIGNIASMSGHVGVNVGGTFLSYYGKMMRGEDEVVEVETEMKKLVAKITSSVSKANGERPARLVVFIDDLDRCAPQNLVSLFEWLKNHLRTDNCTYVIALDHEAAARAIVGEYGNYLGPSADVAYGYRYLEKLVDAEYELASTTKAEEMAIRQVYGEDFPYTNLEDIARAAVGGDFPGVTNIRELMKLRSLRIPRTMLKIVYKFGTSLNNVAVGQKQKDEDLLKLSGDYPFWLLFLISIYYRLDPNSLTDFAERRGPLFEIFSGRDPFKRESRDGQGDQLRDQKRTRKTQADEQEQDLSEWVKEGPRKEFVDFAFRAKQRSGNTLQPPTADALSLMAKIIRENALPTAQPS
jgi:hypothetical protein